MVYILAPVVDAGPNADIGRSCAHPPAHDRACALNIAENRRTPASGHQIGCHVSCVTCFVLTTSLMAHGRSGRLATTGDNDTTNCDTGVVASQLGRRAFNARCTARGRFCGTELWFFCNWARIALSRSFAVRPFGIPSGQSWSIAWRISLALCTRRGCLLLRYVICAPTSA